MRSLNRWLPLLLVLVFLVGCGRSEPDLPDFSELVAKNNESVVNIRTTARLPALDSPPEEGGGMPDMDEFLHEFFGFHGGPEGRPEIPGANAGSGFVISRDGLIVTNEHVIAGASEIWVRLADGRELRAELVGADARGDIAVIRVEASDLRPVRIGRSESLRPGQWAMAIGSPFGFEHTVTVGVISGMGRALPNVDNETYVPYLQTDVAINPGNSGGPLFNLRGEVIGVNAQIFTETGSYSGLSFAIPIDYAMRVVEQLRATGEVKRGFLGVRIQDVNRDLARSLGLERVEGALVTAVLDDSPAAKAGLEVGDVILSADRRRIRGSTSLPQIIGSYPPGTRVALDILRDNRRLSLAVVLAELPEGPVARRVPLEDEAAPSETVAPELPEAFEQAGLQVEEDEDGRWLIVAIREDGAAARADLRPGDQVLAIGARPMESLAQLGDALESMTDERPLALLIRRGDSERYLALAPLSDS